MVVYLVFSLHVYPIYMQLYVLSTGHVVYITFMKVYVKWSVRTWSGKNIDIKHIALQGKEVMESVKSDLLSLEVNNLTTLTLISASLTSLLSSKSHLLPTNMAIVSEPLEDIAKSRLL